MNPAARRSSISLFVRSAASFALTSNCRDFSTLIAAEKTGRVCRGVEFDPLYVDVIVRRYETATGNPAVLVETDETFDAMAARRVAETLPA